MARRASLEGGLMDAQKAKSAPQPRDALFTTDSQILPSYPFRVNAHFSAEVLPTPLREPATVVQLLIRWDTKAPLPSDWAQTAHCALLKASHRANVAEAMPSAAKAFWGIADE